MNISVNEGKSFSIFLHCITVQEFYIQISLRAMWRHEESFQVVHSRSSKLKPNHPIYCNLLYTIFSLCIVLGVQEKFIRQDNITKLDSIFCPTNQQMQNPHFGHYIQLRKCIIGWYIGPVQLQALALMPCIVLRLKWGTHTHMLSTI